MPFVAELAAAATIAVRWCFATNAAKRLPRPRGQPSDSRLGGALLGAASRATFVSNTTLLQKTTPASQRGRVAILRMGLVSLLSLVIVAPAAGLIGGNIAHGYFLGAGLVAGFGVIGLCARLQVRPRSRATSEFRLS